ncbi:histidine kinase [uncultured Tenacibaculum sp.]|uniref:sensor histidine kinase n=1 Tax=uncultured Tenacibaculum sp. TaxID=174713 RepID=UPI002623D5AC|nr:histidine kinase [uncultured Tenacibaculum sp.]
MGNSLLYSQEPVSIHLTEKDGLPDIEFYDIIEDKKGFIWLAANKGLFRYDGKSFKNYTHPEKKGLSVFGLKIDHKDRLWCNNISGQYFYIENDSLKYFTDLKKQNEGQLPIFFIKDNKLYTYVMGRNFEIDLKTKEKKEIFKDSTRVYSSLFIHNDSLFCSRKNDILFTKANLNTIRIDTINNNSYRRYAMGELKIDNLGKNNDILLQSIDIESNFKKFFLRNNHKFKELKLNEFNLGTTINGAITDENIVWLATPKGIYKYEYENGQFTQLNHFFKDKNVTKIIKDSNDNYWLTTLRNGVYIIPNINLIHYQNTSNQNISAIEKINDSIFFYGTTKGKLFKINKKNDKTTIIPTFSNTIINEIAFNNFNKIIVSHAENGIVIENNKIKKLLGFPIKFGGAKEISFIDKNRFVYGAFAYATIANLKYKTTERIGFRRSYTTHYNIQNNTIYVGYVDGVEYYREDFTPHEIKFKESPIFALDIDNTKDSTAWIATFSDGIIGIKNGKVIENYTTKNGLLSNQTRVVKGNGNNLWVVTDKGIQYLNTITKTFKNITKKDGLESFNISDIITYKNQIYFGTNKGLYLLNKNKAFKETKLPDFYITKVLVEDEDMKIEKEYTLPSKVNKVQFQFHTNGFLSEENINYQYRLLGASKHWNSVPAGSNQITFNSLSAGNYTFQIKKVSTIDQKETPIKSIKIKIRNPFYKEWWFIAVLILISSLFIVRYYRKKLKEKEKEKELVFLKLENLRSQMNPHFVFNALNSIQDYILTNQKNIAGDYLGKFADLIRMYLYHSTKANISLEEEIIALNQYLELEKLRFEDSFIYQISSERIRDLDTISIPTMLIQPYVENSIKHGLLHKKNNRNLKIEFTLEKDNSNLICIITDNGIGRQKSIQLNKKRKMYHKSFATKANQDRLSLLNHGRKEKIGVEIIDLYQENGKPNGTLVVLKIPYKTL